MNIKKEINNLKRSDLSDSEAFCFISGWNSALEEMKEEIIKMVLEARIMNPILKKLEELKRDEN